MKETTKRILSLVLAFVMVLGLLPGLSVNVSAAEVVIDAAIFCSDVHGNPSTVTSVFNGIKSADSTFAPSTASFVGDTQCASSSVTSAAQSVFPGVGCYYAFGNHDDEGNYGISDVTGLIYGDSTTNYYIYAISENSMASSNPDTSGFTSTVAGLDKTKPLFIISHLPLHSRRGDSNGAAVWYPAISAAADEMDIFFFWAHNHTGDNDTDRAAYYVAKDGSETITLEDTSTVVTPNFTYANAGYIDPPNTPARNNVATAVRIYEDSVNLTVYNASGELSGTYAVNETVAREFAAETEVVTLSSIAVSGTTEYTVGDELALTVTATYSDGSTADVTADAAITGYDMTAAGTYTVTATYEGLTATATISVKEAQTTDPTEDTTPATDPTDPTEETTAPDEGEVPPPESATGSGSTTTKEEKTVYVLVDTPTADNQYIIVSSGSAGTGYALKENTTTGSSITINAAGNGIDAPYIETTDETIMWNTASGMTFQSENGGYYLRYNSGLTFSTRSSTDWTVGTNTAYTYSNSRYRYLYNNYGTWTTSSSRNTSTSYKAYFYEKQTVEVETTTTASGTYSIEGTPAEVTKVVTAGATATLGSTLTFTPDDGGEVTTTDTSTTADFEIYSDPDGILSGINGNTVTFSGAYGKALVKVIYETSFGTVTNYITVTATEPTYSIEITEADEIVTDTIIIKNVEAGDTHELWAKLFYTDENGQQENTLDTSKLTWASNDTSIATVEADGTVTFTGVEGEVQITAYYAYADGKQVTDTITISVSKFSYVVPGDGTDDFPEYPNQGAIRIDKTAVAQGTFSQTGIAKVELSMTGVPYGTSAKTDVVIMVDMTASMSDDDVTAAELAVQELIKSLVYDEENDKYDSNIQLFIDVFYSASSDSAFETEEYLNNVTISNATELAAAQSEIDFTQSSQGGGTRYNMAMADVYETLTRDGHADNQFVVFVSDGVATAYAPLADGELGTTITGSNSETSSLAAGWFDDSGEVTSDFETEYYSYMIKTAGIPIYTVGANLTALSDAADVLNHMSSNYSPDGKTSTGQTNYSFFCTTSGGVTDQVLEIFAGIGQDIREAAVNVVVEDKIADEYTVNFSLPSGVTADEAGMDDFYIQVLGYELDENNERKDDPEILEKFLFDSNGTITHTIGSNACGDTCTHVTYTDGVVTAIDGTYFDYASSAKGEFLTWNAEKLDRTELALEYFVYLDNSAGYPAAEQVAPGTYDTNEYAHITYTNFNGNECRQYFPVPSLTWNGAQVTYVFYLVNDDGQPVNRAGKIIPFAEAVYVTDPVTYDVTWNEEAGTENLLAENLFASANVPDVYSLYDEQAYYEIRVYQTEGVDDENAVNYNYFTISGAADKLIDSAMDSDTTVDNSTTKVFNTKAGIKYDEYGVYSAQSVGTKLNTTDIDGNPTVVTTTVKTTDIDYANTTVAFAVVWRPELVEDVVVVDYGLDVVIDVYSNDGLAAGVTGVMLNAPDGIGENDGTYSNAVGSASIASDDGLWTASRENLTSVRFHMNEMGISNAVKFYYEAGVNYYTYDSSGKATLTTTNMYSSVTVIPATTIYYEDEFVDLKTFTKQEDGTYTEAAGWTKNSTNATATQDQDRPGASKISDAIDADNNYGYDSAYETMSQFSMGSAAMVTVKSGTYATAEFTFYGTGFDIISMTDTTTGTILIDVYQPDGTLVVSEEVDTYYGYKRVDGEWVATTENDPNALYQVPVMKIGDGTTTEVLPYGQYTAVITVSYLPFLDPNAAKEGYDFYLDAIRIYNPTGNQDQTSVDAYIKDGEAYPEYFEVRDQIIGKETFDALEDEAISGIVFIDGAIADPTIEDYQNYGPNNELYLAKDQAVAFELNAAANAGEVAKIQLAVKTVGGTGDVEVYSVGTDSTKTAGLSETIETATDMYYDITELNGKTVVIRNAGTDEDAIISITNVKVTYTEPQTTEAAAASEETVETAEAPAMFSIRRSTASAAVLSLTEDEQIPEETEPETTVPEETEPETTVPEETEPETTVPEETEPETTVPEETEPEATEPDDEPSGGGITDPIIELIRKLLGWIFG